MTQAIDEQELLCRLRGGQDEAFSELYEEHAPAVRRLARGIAADRSEAEDITAETFFRVLRAIKRGSGPRDNVRGYLLTVARRVAWEWKGASHDVPVSDDELTSRAGVSEFNAARTAEHTLITRAFTSLPERWRTVLWQTEVEGEQPAAVGPKFGLSANATAALARRARQGLRAAYLQAHLATNHGNVGCRSVLEKLGSYTAGGVTGTEASRINAHLSACSGCRSTHHELRDVCHSLRAHSGVGAAMPAVVGVGAGSAASGSGFGGAFKTVLGGAKVKVGAAIVSTAVVGVLGFGAGPVLSEYTAEVLGLNGQQGIGEVTIERSTGENSPPDGDPASDPGLAAERWGLPDEIPEQRKPGDKQTVKDEPVSKKLENKPAEPPASPAEQRRDATPGATADERRAAEGSAAGGTGNQRRTTTGQPTETPNGNQSTNSTHSAPAGDNPPANGSDQSGSAAKPPPPSEERPAEKPPAEDPPPPDSSEPAHDCVDDYEYYEYYNAEKRRTEIYEYSYQDGYGYERLEYRYDNGESWSSETWWYDNC